MWEEVSISVGPGGSSESWSVIACHDMLSMAKTDARDSRLRGSLSVRASSCRTLQNELSPNQAKVSVKQIAIATRPGPVSPA